MEVERFISEFKLLWKKGYRAHLNLESHAGEAWIGLHVNLGPGPSGQPVHSHQQPHQPNHCSPSRQRRRERRAAARAATTEKVDVVPDNTDHQQSAEIAVKDIVISHILNFVWISFVLELTQ